MGGKFSKNKVVASLSMEDWDPGYQSDLTSYEAACRADPGLQYFDKTLQDLAYRVIRTLTGDAKNQSPAFNSVRDATLDLLEMDHELAKVIRASKEDICKNNELFRFVEDYLDHGSEILEFYTCLKGCLGRARDSQSSIWLALKHFEEERGENVGGERYVKTLQELRKFKEADDPFTDEFSKLFPLVRNQQAEMLQKLQARKKKLDKNLKNAQAGRMVTNAIFVTAFVSTLIFSVVAVAIAAPPVVTALAATLIAPIGSVGKWCDSLWKNYRRALKEKKEWIGLMEMGTEFSIHGLNTIQSPVKTLKTQIESILQKADFAFGVEEEEAMKKVMSEIEKQAEAINETIKDLDAQAGKSITQIQQAITERRSAVSSLLMHRKLYG